MSGVYSRARHRDCDDERPLAVPTTKPTPPLTIAAALNFPRGTVIAIQMKAAINPASSALMTLGRFDRPVGWLTVAAYIDLEDMSMGSIC